MSDEVTTQTSSPSVKSNSDSGLILYTVIALGIALIVRFFIAAPYVVSGSSMEPNFYDWHYLIVDRVTYHFESPQRGDVIVLDLPQDTSRALIKRVIGLPGETVDITGNTVTITNAAHPQGFVLNEPYLSPENLGGASNIHVTLNADQFFVLGDNRRVSADSRIWGLLPRSDIVGRAIIRLYPFSDIGLFPAEARYTTAATSTK